MTDGGLLLPISAEHYLLADKIFQFIFHSLQIQSFIKPRASVTLRRQLYVGAACHPKQGDIHQLQLVVHMMVHQLRLAGAEHTSCRRAKANICRRPRQIFVVTLFVQEVLLRSCVSVRHLLSTHANPAVSLFIIAAHILQFYHFYICEQKNKVRQFFVAIARLS